MKNFDGNCILIVIEMHGFDVYLQTDRRYVFRRWGTRACKAGHFLRGELFVSVRKRWKGRPRPWEPNPRLSRLSSWPGLAPGRLNCRWNSARRPLWEARLLKPCFKYTFGAWKTRHMAFAGAYAIARFLSSVFAVNGDCERKCNQNMGNSQFEEALPGWRTETKYWQKYAYPAKQMNGPGLPEFLFHIVKIARVTLSAHVERWLVYLLCRVYYVSRI